MDIVAGILIYSGVLAGLWLSELAVKIWKSPPGHLGGGPSSFKKASDSSLMQFWPCPRVLYVRVQGVSVPRCSQSLLSAFP